MNYFTAGLDLSSAAVGLVLILGILYSKHKREKKYLYFSISVILLTLFCVVDGVSYLLDEVGRYNVARTILTAMSFLGADFILPVFVCFIYENVKETVNMSTIHLKVVVLGSFLDFCVIMYGTITGDLFRIVDGVLEYGAIYNYIGIMQLVLNSYFAIQIFRNRKRLNRKIMHAVGVYLLLPMMAIVIEMLLSGVTVTYIATMIALLIAYITIVSEEMQESFLSEVIMYQASITDNLTGLNNRRAYSEDVELLDLKPVAEDFVYISMDVNGLKTLNDSKGHAAGDEMIKGAAECMQQCFGPYGKVYRTGGDEFIAMINASKEQFEQIKEDFDTTCSSWKGQLADKISVSYGYITGAEAAGKRMHELSMISDKRMYENKSAFYRQKGVDRRGQKEAHVALCEMYTKILKINITEDTYQIVNMDVSEQTSEKGFSNSISAWLSDFGKSGQVHPEDLEDYLSKTNIEYMKEYFHRDKTSLSIFYRRKYVDGYKSVMMEIIPANDYTKENQSLFLYVKSIDR